LSKQAGVEIIELSPAERARWDEATKSVEKDWFAEMDAKGLPATAMYNDIVKMKGK
jgi:TRAP-type C4-dicarboxylate transport system substrate-binding protein